jgi:acyl-ACP thioesterase
MDRPQRAPGAVELLPPPAHGRIFRTGRPVRLGDVGPDGRLRLDALARYVQDVAGDDSDDAGLEDAAFWVVRRAVIEQVVPLRFRERLELSTFCSGIGSRWAERRVSVVGAEGGRVEAVSLWVHVDAVTGRPKPVGPRFDALYGEAAAGRVVDGRLRHDALTPADAGVGEVPWLPRVSDLDVLDHVNNAIAWSVVEQAVARAARSGPTPGAWARSPRRVEVEYRDPVDRAFVEDGPHPVVLFRVRGDTLDVTVRAPGGAGSPVFVTARVDGRQPRGASTRP